MSTPKGLVPEVGPGIPTCSAEIQSEMTAPSPPTEFRGFKRRLPRRPYMGGNCPTTLPALPHSDEGGCLGDPTQRSGTWKVVIHTMGAAHCNGELLQYLQKVPGLSGRRWSPGKLILDSVSGDVYADFDICLNLAHGTSYVLRDPADGGPRGLIQGENISAHHDGGNGYIQFEFIERYEERLKTMCLKLLEQLGHGGRASALERARQEGRSDKPVLHLVVMCNKGRHRAEGVATFLERALEVLWNDVGVVVRRRHHLRPGPHDDRGRCGCHIGNCALDARGSRTVRGRMSRNLAEKAQLAFLELAKPLLGSRLADQQLPMYQVVDSGETGGSQTRPPRPREILERIERPSLQSSARLRSRTSGSTSGRAATTEGAWGYRPSSQPGAKAQEGGPAASMPPIKVPPPKSSVAKPPPPMPPVKVPPPKSSAAKPPPPNLPLLLSLSQSQPLIPDLQVGDQPGTARIPQLKPPPPNLPAFNPGPARVLSVQPEVRIVKKAPPPPPPGAVRGPTAQRRERSRPPLSPGSPPNFDTQKYDYRGVVQIGVGRAWSSPPYEGRLLPHRWKVGDSVGLIHEFVTSSDRLYVAGRTDFGWVNIWCGRNKHNQPSSVYFVRVTGTPRMTEIPKADSRADEFGAKKEPRLWSQSREMAELLDIVLDMMHLHPGLLDSDCNTVDDVHGVLSGNALYEKVPRELLQMLVDRY